VVQGYFGEDSPVKVLDAPFDEHSSDFLNQPAAVSLSVPFHSALRILVDIRMSNGVHVSQKNLSCDGLQKLVEKLEGLC
jgi:hypothetical protein